MIKSGLFSTHRRECDPVFFFKFLGYFSSLSAKGDSSMASNLSQNTIRLVQNSSHPLSFFLFSFDHHASIDIV